MKDLLKSPKVRSVLWTLGVVVAVLVVFGAGAAVGYRRALFASRFGQNYYRNFYGGSPGGMMGLMGPIGKMSFSMHGVAGEVINVSSSSISVMDPSGNEQSVAIIPETLIREDDGTITVGELQAGDMVTVIGGPNGEGQIEARFIRVFPSSSSSSMPFNQ